MCLVLLQVLLAPYPNPEADVLECFHAVQHLLFRVSIRCDFKSRQFIDLLWKHAMWTIYELTLKPSASPNPNSRPNPISCTCIQHTLGTAINLADIFQRVPVLRLDVSAAIILGGRVSTYMEREGNIKHIITL